MNFSNILFGGDYNPDQWPEETWAEDVQLMKKAGVNLVSLGIFSWAKLEPKPGEFNFGWLDRLMDLLHDNGIAVDLATPTASPPAWMAQSHPDILPVSANGETLWHGSRRHYCPHSADYAHYALRIAEKLAERYQDHPALKMWHIDNEYGCHISECYCDTSAAAFRIWLEERYQTIDALNHAWGTAFWGQIYNDWGQIQPPRKAPAHINPTQQLDWTRFSSDSWLDCFNAQKAVIKQITPDIPVTTNFMGFHKGVDYFKFARNEDLVSNDSYPDTWQADWMVQAAMICDLIRSVGNNQPWLLMEQSASQVNWRSINTVKRPGVMRLGSLQAIAHGADGILFFQWRQSKAGAEKHHSGMLPHGGTDTRIWREIKMLGNELKGLKPLVGSQSNAEVAILMDWNNWWALEIDSKPSADLRMLQQLTAFYQPLYEKNIAVDFVHPAGDLSHYKLIVAPNLYLVDAPSVENINRFVENGGHLLMTFFSGIVDENEHIRLGGYPAPFCELLGLSVEEYVPFPRGVINSFKTNDGKNFKSTLWADVIQSKGAEGMSAFEKDYFAGRPAVTVHPYGKGCATYLGTMPDRQGLDWLLEQTLSRAGVTPQGLDLPPEVECCVRRNEGKTWVFLLNFGSERVVIPFKSQGIDLLSGKAITSFVELDGISAAVIELEQDV